MFFTRIRNDQHQMVLFSNSGSESLFLYPTLALPVDPSGSFVYTANFDGNTISIFTIGTGGRKAFSFCRTTRGLSPD